MQLCWHAQPAWHATRPSQTADLLHCAQGKPHTTAWKCTGAILAVSRQEFHTTLVLFALDMAHGLALMGVVRTAGLSIMAGSCAFLAGSFIRQLISNLMKDDKKILRTALAMMKAALETSAGQDLVSSPKQPGSKESKLYDAFKLGDYETAQEWAIWYKA